MPADGDKESANGRRKDPKRLIASWEELMALCGRKNGKNIVKNKKKCKEFPEAGCTRKHIPSGGETDTLPGFDNS